MIYQALQQAVVQRLAVQLEEEPVLLATLRDAQIETRVLGKNLRGVKDRSVVFAVYQILQHSGAQQTGEPAGRGHHSHQQWEDGRRECLLVKVRLVRVSGEFQSAAEFEDEFVGRACGYCPRAHVLHDHQQLIVRQMLHGVSQANFQALLKAGERRRR